MMRAAAILILLLCIALPATAQDTFWVQVEARQSVAGTQSRAQEYAARLDNVHGFYLGDGWYGIFIGPFSETGTEAELARLLALGAVPSDSFVKNGQFFKEQVWPVTTGDQTAVTVPVAATAKAVTPPVPDESPSQARASEALLTLADRQALQRALQWAGYYDATVDGVFGPGTRTSMRIWQKANDFGATGVLTTNQRQMLLDAYNSVLDGLDLLLVRDDASGIEMLVPTAVVAFTEYNPPFVNFPAKGDLDAQVLFISQEGDATNLLGLYEIMQSLEIIPAEGPRSITENSFEIEGIGDGIHSYTTVTMQAGDIKGFTLVWPADDEARRRRVLDEMKASFGPLDAVLDINIARPGEDQAYDLVSGLAVRKPRFTRSGFFVDDQGTVLTTYDAVQGCERVTFDNEYTAEVITTDTTLGISVLRAQTPLTPLGVAEFQLSVPRIDSAVAVAGFPYNGVLVTPSLTFGAIADIRGLNGDERIKRLTIPSRPGDWGGPVFDASGAVMGMLLPRGVGATAGSPPDVNFALDSDEIVPFLSASGITTRATQVAEPVPPAQVTRRAVDITVLVSCW